MKFRLLPITLFFPLLLIAQNQLSRAQALEDYIIFKNILTTGHPALYAYTSAGEWDSIFGVFEQQTINEISTPEHLFRSISSMAANVRDGHLVMLHPKMDTVPHLFPLLLKVINEALYTDTDDFGIPIGAKIISINDMPDHVILQRLLKYAPSDGYNLTKKYRQIEREFGILHYYEFGSSVYYTVQYITPDGDLKTTEITSKSMQSIGDRYANRNSLFAAYHQNPNSSEHFKTRIVEKWPFVYYIDSINTAVLTVHSFGLDPKVFLSKLTDLFKEIRKKKTTDLIIDIRQNNGGYRINAIHLFSFLTHEPFQQRVQESAITDVLPEEKYILHTMSDYKEFFDMYFATAKKEGGRWVLTEDHAQAKMIPSAKSLKNKVYVLIGGNTFSAGAAFALNAKNSNQITLVGEETGGGYYFHTGQYPVVYELPNSKIMMRMSFVKIDKYVLDSVVPKGSGIVPDIEIVLTVQDLIAGKDSQLDYVVKRISRDRNAH